MSGMNVGRESISKLMTELVDSFPMESEGRASISDFGKLLFAEGQNSAGAAPVKSEPTIHEHQPLSGGNGAADEDDDAEDDDPDDDVDDDAVDDEPTPGAGAGQAVTTGTKRVFTEIKGVPRQKHHDVQCVVTETGNISITEGSMHKLLKAKEKAIPKRWTPEEDNRLREAVNKHGERNWKSIAEEVPGRNHTQCLQRWTKVLAPGLVKGHWRPDEDELLKELVAEGRKNWGQVANRIPGRTSKQCRERWYNHLDPSIIRGEYTAEEDRIILEAQARLGNKWSTIAAMLPGRTEDAVKIRWKSLCRVRKGQNRRTGQPEKTKQVVAGKPVVPSGFHGAMVKSEELSSFGPIPTQATPMGRVPVVQQMVGHPGQTMTMNGVPTMVYAPTGYNPSMGPYPKTHVVMQSVNAYGQPMPVIAVPANEFNIDRRANVVNISSPSGGSAYRQVYTSTSNPYAAIPATATGPDANGNMFSHGSVPAYIAANGAMYRVQGPAAAMPAGQMGTTYPTYPNASMGMQQPPPAGTAQQYSQQFVQANAGAPGYGHVQYGQPGMGNGQAMPQTETQPQTHTQHQQEGQSTTDQSTSSQRPLVPNNPTGQGMKQSGPSLAASFAQTLSTPKTSNAPSPAAMFAQSLGSKPAATTNPTGGFSQSQQMQNSSKPANASPAAMFAHNLSKSATTTAQSSPFNRTPVGAFLQQQQPRPANVGAGGDSQPSAPAPAPKPFNPAAAFAQRLQTPAQKPPMPASAASTRSTEDEANLTEEERDEPSLKKVKPRNSIDMAARASAARRLRNSGTGGALMGRQSLDVFLNEIGDVGRISDLKMDEFQTMDELWRVSGDMDRLSL